MKVTSHLAHKDFSSITFEITVESKEELNNLQEISAIELNLNYQFTEVVKNLLVGIMQESRQYMPDGKRI